MSEKKQNKLLEYDKCFFKIIDFIFQTHPPTGGRSIFVQDFNLNLNLKQKFFKIYPENRIFHSLVGK